MTLYSPDKLSTKNWKANMKFHKKSNPPFNKNMRNGVLKNAALAFNTGYS